LPYVPEVPELLLLRRAAGGSLGTARRKPLAGLSASSSLLQRRFFGINPASATALAGSCKGRSA